MAFLGKQDHDDGNYYKWCKYYLMDVSEYIGHTPRPTALSIQRARHFYHLGWNEIYDRNSGL